MCLSSYFLSHLLCSCIEWCNCKNCLQNRHKNTFSHSLDQALISTDAHVCIYMQQELNCDVLRKNRIEHTQQEQTYVQSASCYPKCSHQIKIKFTNAEICMHTIQRTLALHAPRACTKVILTGHRHRYRQQLLVAPVKEQVPIFLQHERSFCLDVCIYICVYQCIYVKLH